MSLRKVYLVCKTDKDKYDFVNVEIFDGDIGIDYSKYSSNDILFRIIKLMKKERNPIRTFFKKRLVINTSQRVCTNVGELLSDKEFIFHITIDDVILSWCDVKDNYKDYERWINE